MNTFRILSLIALVGVTASPIMGMEPKTPKEVFQNAVEIGTKAATNLATTGQTIVHNGAKTVAELTAPVAPEVVTEEVASKVTEVVAPVAPAAKSFMKMALEKGGNVITLATDHPYYTAGAGIVAIVILGGIEYVVYKNGHIKTVYQACKDHKYITGTVVTLTIAAGGAYIANQMGYIDISAATNTVTSTICGYVPSIESVKGYLGWKAAAAATGLAITGYGANWYFNGKTEANSEETPKAPQTVGDNTTTKQVDANSTKGKLEAAIKTGNIEVAETLIAQLNLDSNTKARYQSQIDELKKKSKSKSLIESAKDYIPKLNLFKSKKTEESVTKEVVTEIMLNQAIMISKNPNLAQKYLDTLLEKGVLTSGAGFQARIDNLRG